MIPNNFTDPVSFSHLMEPKRPPIQLEITGNGRSLSGMNLDLVFDPICPWCFIGKRRLEQAFALRPNIAPEFRWRPFLLNPEMPESGVSRSDYMLKKCGSEQRVRRTAGAIEAAGESVEINFRLDDIERTPSTVNAHRLVFFADRNGMASVAVEALFQAFFIRGCDIGDVGELMGIGNDIGLDPGDLREYLLSDEDLIRVQDENALTHRLGINGVPTYIFNESLTISGAQDPQVLARLIDAAGAGAGQAA